MKNRWYYSSNKRTVYIILNNHTTHVKISSRQLSKLINLDVTWYCKDNYVVANIRQGSKRKTLLLHRYLTNCPNDKVVDHRNGDTFNNKPYNLRVVTVGQNNQNLTRTRTDSTTGVRGVTYRQGNVRPYIAQVRINGVHVLNKSFFTLEEARLEAEYVRRQYLKYSYQDEKETNK